MALILNEAFTGTNGDAWNTSNWTNPRNVSGSGSNTIESNRGRLQATGAAYAQHAIMVAGSTEDDFDLLFTFAFDSASEQYFEPVYRAGTNLTTGSPYNGYSVTFSAAGDAVVLARKTAASGYTNLSSIGSAAINNTTRRWVRIRVEGGDHQVKWWNDGSGEPGVSQIIVTSETTYTSGRILLTHTNGAAGTARYVDLDDMTIDNLTAGATSMVPQRRRQPFQRGLVTR